MVQGIRRDSGPSQFSISQCGKVRKQLLVGSPRLASADLATPSQGTTTKTLESRYLGTLGFLEQLRFFF